MFISLDLETTGFYPEKDKIIEFGAIKFDLNGNTETLQFLINPGIQLPQIITHITGITDKDLKNAPKFKDKKQEILEFLKDYPIIGHNIQFDTGFLKANNLNITNLEYDTCALASMIIPGLPSYSLEILSQRLDLKHKEKHRALDDSIAAMELFLKLTNKFKELPKEIIEKTHLLCQKTNHPLKNFLLQINRGKTQKLKQKPIKETQNQPTPTFTETDEYIKKENSFIEISPPYENLIKALAKKENKDSYISIPNHIFKTLISKLPENIARIDIPKKYISTRRLKELEEKNFLENHEFSALLKYIIWLTQTKTGHLSEITLFNEEKITIPRVNIDENIVDPLKEEFFIKAINKEKQSPAICSHQYLIEKTPEADQILIFDFEHFTKDIFYTKTEILKLDFLLNQLNAIKENSADTKITELLNTSATILFGLIGLLFENHNDNNLYAPRTEIKEEILETKEFQNVKATINNLIESSKKLGPLLNEKTKGHLKNWKKSLQILHETLVNPDIENRMIRIEKDFNENLVIISSPCSLEPYFKKIIENCENYKIISQHLDINDDCAFAKSLLGIKDNPRIIKKTEKRENVNIFIAQNSSNEKDQIKNFFIPYLKKQKGPTAIILNSKKQLQFITVELGKELKSTNMEIISQLTGSLGKLKEQFKTSKKDSILLITPNFWENFDNHDAVKNLIIQKIPFDPPSDPFIVAMSKNFEDQFNEFQIPRAILSLNKLINLLPSDDKSDDKKEIIILDSRVMDKKYGEKILDNLEKIAATKILNLATLL